MLTKVLHHFVGENGPTASYPDPIQADGSTSQVNTIALHLQTKAWVSPVDMLLLSAELHQLRSTVEMQEKNVGELINKQQSITPFGVKKVLAKEDQVKGLFKYYTGITWNFLVPPGSCVSYEKGRADIKTLSNEDCLFLTICRLRHDFGLKDICMRFGLTLQSTGVVFNTWIDHISGQLSIWPHRDTIIENMPTEYRRDFPTSLIIIDGTELKTQTPCALGLQSQLYSDYKSSTTLKCPIGCDPSGSVIFVSGLHSDSISDKTITKESGFYETLKTLNSQGYLNDGDAIMADKGFTIGEELGQLGLNLNIPPFTKSGSQMSSADVKKTSENCQTQLICENIVFGTIRDTIRKCSHKSTYLVCLLSADSLSGCIYQG
ncbi:uncharacterized protein LOC110446645 [Mizuhopecten yessoensis]|uniref:uncharacterized protein LOC110446645 n=1 Tax=Mizuhopecten yessoensis TaxID=6573 RepID=UPI000B45A82B|nr:uncharacterized protein LOC110446645 [Mizuhopecten yessoensis]